MRQLLVLDSRYRMNPEETQGFVYKFKLNKNIRFNGRIRLEQFIFQNSQYVFSEQKRSNKFIISEDLGDASVITIEGMFDTADSFVKRFNEIMTSEGLRIRMIYTASLYEFKIQHLDGQIFQLEEYYESGSFMDLLGFEKMLQGQHTYTNTKVPKLFSQNLIYITLPEIGSYSTVMKDLSYVTKGFTFLVVSKPGFEIISNINNTFANEFYVDNKEIDELTVQIRGDDGQPFVNNKGNANFIIVLSY